MAHLHGNFTLGLLGGKHVTLLLQLSPPREINSTFLKKRANLQAFGKPNDLS